MDAQQSILTETHAALAATAAESANELAHGAFAPTRAQRSLIALAHRSTLGRGTFRPMVSRVIAALRAGPIDGYFHDLPFRMHHRTNGAELGMLLNPAYNRAELAFLCAQTPQGGCFVDAGASVGPYSLVMAQHVGTSGRVIAIEPHPAARARFAFNRAAAGFAHVELFAVAVSDREGELMLEIDRRNLFAGRLGVADGLRVPVRPLAAIVADAGLTRIDSLKIDVEGFEDRALMPFFRTAPASLWPHAVVIEHLERADWRHDCIDDMTARGYAICSKTRSNTLLIRSG
jgi:FkbM family methyltransferase